MLMGGLSPELDQSGTLGIADVEELTSWMKLDFGGVAR